tara:strand:- start:237 stop:653 length:417 start_codon:yes stop_codon:yes gene_type:complete
MELYIQIKDGQPFEHPILGDNFREAFPDVDTNNLPPEFASFTRIETPLAGAYEVYEGVEYQLQEDGSYKDVHTIRDMTAEEKTAKQDAVKADWEANGFASWTFNEGTCSFDPPAPYPDDGKAYIWNEDITSWEEVADA